MRVLSETLDLKKTPKNISPIGVLVRYRVLNGEDLTIMREIWLKRLVRLTQIVAFSMLSCISNQIVSLISMLSLRYVFR